MEVQGLGLMLEVDISIRCVQINSDLIAMVGACGSLDTWECTQERTKRATRLIDRHRRRGIKLLELLFHLMLFK